MIGVPSERQPATEKVIRPADDWVAIAECIYGFDRQTAQRLSFIRWLCVTGRLEADSRSHGYT